MISNADEKEAEEIEEALAEPLDQGAADLHKQAQAALSNLGRLA